MFNDSTFADLIFVDFQHWRFGVCWLDVKWFNVSWFHVHWLDVREVLQKNYYRFHHKGHKWPSVLVSCTISVINWKGVTKLSNTWKKNKFTRQCPKNTNVLRLIEPISFCILLFQKARSYMTLAVRDRVNRRTS